MLRTYLMAGVTLACIVAPALALSTAAQAGGPRDDLRWYLIKSDNGTCSVRMSRRDDVLGRYNSRSGADRALAMHTECRI